MRDPLLPPSNSWARWIEVTEALALRSLCAVLRRLNWRQTETLAALVGAAMHLLIFTRRAVAIRNLRIAFPALSRREADRRARAASVCFVQSMFHFLRFPALTTEEFRQRVPLFGFEEYRRAAARGRGVIILTAHLGNWEFLGARLVAEGAPLAVIARERSNSTVGRIMRATRETARMQVIDKDQGMLAATRWLKHGRALGVLPDQHASWQGIPLSFFGRMTPMHPVVARLARHTGCAVLPCYCTRENGGYVARIHPELALQRTTDKDADLRENTCRMTRLLEEQIGRYPEQWLWVHKRWRDNDNEYLRYARGEFTRAAWEAGLVG